MVPLVEFGLPSCTWPLGPENEASGCQESQAPRALANPLATEPHSRALCTGTKTEFSVWGASGSLRALVSGQWWWAVRKKGFLRWGLLGRLVRRAGYLRYCGSQAQGSSRMPRPGSTLLPAGDPALLSQCELFVWPAGVAFLCWLPPLEATSQRGTCVVPSGMGLGWSEVSWEAVGNI